MEITYTEKDGILYPDLALPETTNHNIGKYGHLRLSFLKHHRRATYTSLLTEGKLNEYLDFVDVEANEMLNEIIKNSIEDSTLMEKLKVEDQMKWIKLMNGIKAYAEEIVLQEVVYQ